MSDQDSDSDPTPDDETEATTTSRLSLTRREAVAALAGAGALGTVGAVSSGDVNAGIGGGPMANQIGNLKIQFYEGTMAERPDPGVDGRFFRIDDPGTPEHGNIYEDTGTSWDLLELGVSSLQTDQVSSNTIPASYVVYKDSGGTIHAVGNGYADQSGSDIGSVINSATANLTDGGLVFIRAGEWTTDTEITEPDNPGVFLLGDGFSWSEGSGSIDYGTVIKAGSNLTDTIYSTAEQFQGARQIAFDGDGQGVYCVRMKARDSVFDRIGARGGGPNVRMGENGWLSNSFIEYPNSQGNIEVVAGSKSDKIKIEGCYIVDGIKGIYTANETFDMQVKSNYFVNNDRSIQFSSPLRDCIFEGNHHKGTGKNSGGSVASVYYGFDELDNTRFIDETVVGEGDQGTQQTDHVLFIESAGAAITGTVEFDVAYSNLKSTAIDNAAGVTGYVFNGRVPDPENIDLGGTDGPITPSDIPVAEAIPLKVDAGGTANTEVESIDGDVVRDGQIVQIIHTGGEAVDLIHNDTAESNPLINQDGTNDTLSTNGDLAEYRYEGQAGKWMQKALVTQ